MAEPYVIYKHESDRTLPNAGPPLLQVSEAKFKSLEDIYQEAQEHPEKYTQWFLEEMQVLDWFGIVRQPALVQ